MDRKEWVCRNWTPSQCSLIAFTSSAIGAHACYPRIKFLTVLKKVKETSTISKHY